MLYLYLCTEITGITQWNKHHIITNTKQRNRKDEIILNLILFYGIIHTNIIKYKTLLFITQYEIPIPNHILIVIYIELKII